jgi:hypothetical protein
MIGKKWGKNKKKKKQGRCSDERLFEAAGRQQ